MNVLERMSNTGEGLADDKSPRNWAKPRVCENEERTGLSLGWTNCY